MSENIKVSDLPSMKYYMELKNNIDYDILQTYNKSNSPKEKIDIWITNFISNMEKYLMNLPQNFSLNHDKRCRDICYLTNDTIQKILSLRDSPFETYQWKAKIQDFRDKYLISNSSFKCNKICLYNKHEKKFLDDFCEDSNYIREKLNEIQKSDQCKSINENMSTRKNELIDILQKENRKHRYTVVNRECSIQKLETIFSPISCISNEKSPLALDDAGRSVSTDRSPAREEESGAPLLLQADALESEEQDSLAEPTEDGINNAIGLGSLPILGIFVFSFLLYKFTPIGPKFSTYWKKERNVFFNHNDDLANGLLENTSNSSDIYSENNKYNVSYHTAQE
ncbi:PIR Superfamily Protein [Plasmodium ovale wallikeri]|uniref:PIR Superfamily Protein n=1 Tax=Plasmodium ovale wallikeri TaxID=864142 RepID=A0A1A9AH57_PLAOA|nr:PIR Superfamily Protein [Plasmodium ovale wallikeri]SBT55527.1 PIR Superfamily Protein [Plasmodium ovale wallikeri]